MHAQRINIAWSSVRSKRRSRHGRTISQGEINVIMPGGVMVARRALDAEIGVQIPARQLIRRYRASST